MKKYQPYYFYGLLLLGMIVRLRAYFYNRSLWFDEALLTNNIIDLSFVELTGVLPNNQAAPVGFLFLQKIVVVALGTSEYVLRLWPLLAALLSLFLFYRLSQKLLSANFALVALAFFVFCQPHIYYSTEVKQYSTDVLAAILVLRSTVQLFEDKSSRYLWRHICLGVLLIWFSQPVVFVLAASFLALSLQVYQEKNSAVAKWLLLIGSCWAVSFLVYFFGFLKPSIANNDLQDFHTTYFMPLNIFAKTSWEWYANAWFSLFRNPAGIFFKYLAGSVGLIGLFVAFRQRKIWLVLLLFPLGLAFAASALHQYSTIPRLLLFAMPGLVLFLVKSLTWFHQICSRKIRFGKYFGALLVAAILLQGVLDTIHKLATPGEVEEIKPLLAYVAKHKKAEDLFYLYPYTAPQFTYYKERYGLENLRIFEGTSPFENWQADLTRLPTATQRVWLLLAHYRKTPQGDDSTLYARQFDQYGKQIVKLEEKGTVCYLYEFKLKR
ncbi:MAG: glycosyltransferase family 39 protein [Saprospiraceae bacterium]